MSEPVNLSVLRDPHNLPVDLAVAGWLAQRERNSQDAVGAARAWSVACVSGCRCH